MRINLTEEQKSKILTKWNWEENSNTYYKDLEVCELFLPMEKSYLTIEMTCDVDINYGVYFDYKNGELVLGMSSQKFTSAEDVYIYGQVVNCLNTDFHTIKNMLRTTK